MYKQLKQILKIYSNLKFFHNFQKLIYAGDKVSAPGIISLSGIIIAAFKLSFNI